MIRVAMPLVLLALSGCMGMGTYVDSQVARFDALPASSQSLKLAIVPLDHQQGDIEFRSYADSLGARLSAQGFSIVEDPVSADLIAFFDYGVGSGRDETFSYPIIGQTGGGTTFHSGTVSSAAGTATFSGSSTTMPSFGVVGAGSGSRRVYDRFFTLEIIDPRASDAKNVEVLYRSEVNTAGSSGTFLPISECVFDAVFEEFRGTGARNTRNGDCYKG